MYGVDKEPTKPFATNCLLARRMVERGVRFVMLMHASWDHHSELNKKLPKNCGVTDQPTAALIKDLKQRGLLDSTLVVWGGRVRPHAHVGRCAVPRRPTMPVAITIRTASASGWPAAASKAARSSEKPTTSAFTSSKTRSRSRPAGDHPACLGFDHTRLTYRHLGRDFRLTDVDGEVVRKMLV